MSRVPSFPGYSQVSVLGQGAMGAVYQAREVATGREVAIKVLLGEVSGARLERFRREAELTARLSHPGILPVHTAGVAQGRPYVVYDLIQGARPFEEACAGSSASERCRLVLSCAEALAAAHAAGIVHRDLKSDNVLVDAEGRVLLIDFGVAAARDLERLTQTGAIVGTPQSMSPEQCSGEGEPRPTMDVWALGVLLFWALSDRYPFEGANLTELLVNIARSEPSFPRGVEVAAPLERVCLRALEKEPSARPPDAGAFAEELRRALEPDARRLPASYLALGGVAALLLAGAVIWVLRPDSADPTSSKSPSDIAQAGARTPEPTRSQAAATPTPARLALPTLPESWGSGSLPASYFLDDPDPILGTLYESARSGQAEEVHNLARYLSRRARDRKRVRGQICSYLNQVVRAEPENHEALRHLSELYAEEGEAARARTCLELAAEAGSARACYELAMHLQREDPKANAARCFELFRAAAQGGDTVAHAVLGYLNLCGEFADLEDHPIDLERAVFHLKTAMTKAKSANVALGAKARLAEAVLSQGKELPGVSVAEAEQLLGEAVARGHYQALMIEGDLLRFGRHRVKDVAAGRVWYRRAHETGNPNCSLRYAEVLLEGEDPDVETARAALEQVAANTRFPSLAQEARDRLARLEKGR